MKEHIQDILVGGRPMTKLEQANKEIERLNNIINELEIYIVIKMNSFGICNAGDIYYKLQELKGDSSN